MLTFENPSVEGLQRLHRRHVERIPYETMWIHLGEAWGIDAVDAVVRIARQGRGGYCFHLNGAFSELLRSLGYAVTRHVGGVHGAGGPDEEMMSNHLVLTVSGLPANQNPSGTWYVDAGLGDALHQALPLGLQPCVAAGGVDAGKWGWARAVGTREVVLDDLALALPPAFAAGDELAAVDRVVEAERRQRRVRVPETQFALITPRPCIRG